MNISFISNQVWLIAALHEPSYLCHLYFVGCLIPNTISSLSHQYRCTLMASFKFLVHRLTLITTKVTWIIGTCTLWEDSRWHDKVYGHFNFHLLKNVYCEIRRTRTLRWGLGLGLGGDDSDSDSEVMTRTRTRILTIWTRTQPWQHWFVFFFFLGGGDSGA